MPLALTPRLLRRGLELFALISLVGVAVVLFAYGDTLPAVVAPLLHLRWRWLLVGLGLASMDWIGGGVRLWVVARHVHPGVRLRDMIVSGGMSAWGAYLTPFQSGAAPMMMYTMKRAGVSLPEAMTSTFMTFVATVAFFAIAVLWPSPSERASRSPSTRSRWASRITPCSGPVSRSSASSGS
jgi:uncharacterized membrane protein YbhN (UPF0104 family)